MLFKRLKNGRKRKSESWILSSWMRYAATFVGIILLSGTIYLTFLKYNTEKESLLTVNTRNEVEQLTLPDGTKVWLNKNSIFRYPKEFDENNREVHLEGEGYFEVKKNSSKPFVVHSESMQVRVLGTIFNLKTDQANRSAIATLVQGEIEVKGNHNEGMIVLTPRQEAELDGVSHRLMVRQIDTGIEHWHNNSFAFESADIFTIARTLEKYYDVSIVLSSDLNTKSTYSGTLMKSEKVEDVLNSVSNAVPIKYRIEDNRVYLSAKF
jgi:transmembrane sensor